MASTWLISEVTAKYHVTPRTLKFYEEAGLLRCARNQKNIRVYDRATLDRLEQILILRRMGISIRNIKMIFDTHNQHEIMEIIARQKSLVGREISQLTDMKAQLAVFIAQIKDDTAALKDFLEACRPKQRWDIDFAELQETLSNEGRHEVETADALRVARVAGGEVLELVSSASKYAVSGDTYTAPLRVNVTAKIHDENLWLFFGGHRMAFVREEGGVRLYCHDQVADCNIEAFERGALPPDEYVDIGWEIRNEYTKVFFNGAFLFYIEYPANYDLALTSEIGIGADHGNAVTIKEIQIQQDGRAPEVVALGGMKWRQCEHYIKNGELVIFNTIDRVMLGTARQFTLPLKIDLTAKTNDTNIRLYYHNGGVILNWERKKSVLRIADVYDMFLYASESGYVTPNEYHDISWVLHADFMSLIVDGVSRFFSRDAQYIDYIRRHTVADIVRIGTAFGSTMTVRSLSVTELEGNDAAP